MFAPVRGAIFVSMIVTLGAFSGCGGGGGGGSISADSGGGTALPARILQWEAPKEYSDATPMNPQTDLDRFEIYVNESGSFDDMAVPRAILSAVNPETRQLTTSFNLADIVDLSIGHHYWVSLRVVARTGLKSEFSLPFSFSF